MTREVDWNSIGGKGSSDGKGKGFVKYVKFEPGSTIEIRPIGKAVEFYRFFIADTNRSVIVSMDNGTKATEMLAEHSGKEYKAVHRFAMNVIDRTDNNQIKVLEGGRSIYKNFGAWAKRTNSHPGGQSGGNWSIEASGKGLNREYTTTFLGPSPISEEERSRIKANGDLYSLEEVFSPCPLNNIIAKAFTPASAGPAAPDVPAAPQVAQADVSSTNDDDPINW